MTGEKQLFQKIAQKRSLICAITGKRIRKNNLRVWCFAHILNKGVYTEYRLVAENIIIVKGIKEHNELDKMFARHKLEYKRKLDKYIRKEISIQELFNCAYISKNIIANIYLQIIK